MLHVVEKVKRRIGFFGLFFGGDSESYFGKCTKKRCSGFWIQSLVCVFFFLAERAKKLYLFILFYFALQLYLLQCQG